MQLTANFVLLATVLAYSSSSVLALPVGSSFAAREVEARDFQDELSYYAREVPESMYFDARGFGGDYQDINARAGAAVDSTPVSVATTPAGAGTPETPVTPLTKDSQKALSGPSDAEGSNSLTTPAADALHPPPAKHTLPQSGRRHRTQEELEEAHKARKARKLAKMTPAELKAYKERKAHEEARLAEMTPAEREAFEQKRKAHEEAWRKMTKAERTKYVAERKAHRAAWERMTPAERTAAKAAKKAHAEGGEKATSESAITGPEGAVEKPTAEPVADGTPETVKAHSTDGASIKPPAVSAKQPPTSA